MLKLYFHRAPNPMKVAFYLAETSLPYELIAVDILKGEQHSPELLRVNPNAKVPAIDDNGTLVFDSSAILLYLAEKTGKLGGSPEQRGELLSWMMFIGTGMGPYSGQAVHFKHMAPEKLDYAINRYHREVQRHYQVLDAHLENRNFIVGDSLSIVDISAWGWANAAVMPLGEHGLQQYPNVTRWFDTMNTFSGAQAARELAQNFQFKSEMDEEARRAMFPQNYSE
ncbi:MAG: glutathione S-transferase family protein [Gammaproteobacteria bacterium]|nr:glutathione S-transferase family protein [Gammaproteobacteria bacterium]